MSASPGAARAAGATKPAGRSANSSPRARNKSDEHPILFQTYFKSVGPRTYAAQIKKANNDNHYLILTEGHHDEKTDQLRKTRLFIYSEDFGAFFRMLHETAQFIKANPVPDEVKKRRERFWAKRNGSSSGSPSSFPSTPREQAPAPQIDQGRGGKATPSPQAPARRPFAQSRNMGEPRAPGKSAAPASRTRSPARSATTPSRN